MISTQLPTQVELVLGAAGAHGVVVAGLVMVECKQELESVNLVMNVLVVT